MPVIRIPLELSVTLEGVDGEDAEVAIEDLVKNNFEMTPMEVVVKSPHGVYQEFGTHAAGKSYGTKVPGQPTVVQQKFRDWAAVKCKAAAAAMGISTNRFGDMVYHKIMTEGMEEHPFFRPALYDVTDRIDEYFVKGGRGTRGMAEDIVTLAKNNLIINKSIYTGELMDSIICQELTEELSDEPASELEEALWNRMGRGAHGEDGER